MHELSIAKNLIEMAETAANDAGAMRVNQLNLQIGQLSGVVSDALLFCFDIAAQGTVVDGATLAIEMLPAVIHCTVCEQDTELPSIQRFRCPRCDASAVHVIQGRELELVSLEIEEQVDRGLETEH